jgi:predicted metal-dependent phosphoesterase TrpH
MESTKGIRADLHMHTFYSKDSNVSPERMIELAKKARLDAIGVTDHNTTLGAKKVAELVKERKEKLIVFIGQETKTKHGEIIVLNVDKDLEKKRGLAETCRKAKKLGGFVILPHPFDPTRSGVDKHIEEALPYVDAVEVFNARSLMDKSNRKARDFALRNRLPGISGSDSHTPQEIGSAATIIRAGRNKDEILKAIRNREIRATGRKAGIMPHIRTFFNRFRKHPRLQGPS